MPQIYRNYQYPALLVFYTPDKSVKFEGTRAVVADEDVEAFEAWREKFGAENGIIKGDLSLTDVDPEAAARASGLGIGYTDAERIAAIGGFREWGDKPAPPPPEDQRTPGVKAAQAQPDATAAAAAAQASDVNADGKVDETDAVAAVSADVAPNDAEGSQDPDASVAGENGADVPDDGLDAATVEELKDLLREKGRPVSGNKDELIARLREE